MKRLQAKIDKNKMKIVQLLNETIDLEYEKNLKRFHRTELTVIDTGTKKIQQLALVKIGYWNEWFKDEDKPKSKGIKIERKEIIEVDGERSYGWEKLKYYTIEDI